MSGWTFALYALVMAGVTYLIRALPFVLIRKKIENRFALSVLYYAPYAVLGAMTVPDIFDSTGNPVSAGAGLVVAFIAAWRGLPMVAVAALAAATAVAAEVLVGG